MTLAVGDIDPADGLAQPYVATAHQQTEAAVCHRQRGIDIAGIDPAILKDLAGMIAGADEEVRHARSTCSKAAGFSR
ncbi:MAG TPA: hypothetical protein VM900_12140 [Sphingomonas sp.]|nr:hypothetical protein [Sphingomonas sp.]